MTKEDTQALTRIHVRRSDFADASIDNTSPLGSSFPPNPRPESSPSTWHLRKEVEEAKERRRKGMKLKNIRQSRGGEIGEARNMPTGENGSGLNPSKWNSMGKGGLESK